MWGYGRDTGASSCMRPSRCFLRSLSPSRTKRAQVSSVFLANSLFTHSFKSFGKRTPLVDDENRRGRRGCCIEFGFILWSCDFVCMTTFSHNAQQSVNENCFIVLCDTTLRLWVDNQTYWRGEVGFTLRVV
jgi:hypothetical protein